MKRSNFANLLALFFLMALISPFYAEGAFVYTDKNFESQPYFTVEDINSLENEQFIDFILNENIAYFDYQGRDELYGSFLLRFQNESFLELFNSAENIALRQKFWEYHQIYSLEYEGYSACEVDFASGNQITTKGLRSTTFDLSKAREMQAKLDIYGCLYWNSFPECTRNEVFAGKQELIRINNDNLEQEFELSESFLNNQFNGQNLLLDAGTQASKLNLLGELFEVQPGTAMQFSQIIDSDLTSWGAFTANGELATSNIRIGSTGTFYFELTDWCPLDETKGCYTSEGYLGSFALSQGRASVFADDGEILFTARITDGSEPLMLTDGFAYSAPKTYPSTRASKSSINYYSDVRDGSHFKFNGENFKGSLSYNLDKNLDYSSTLLETDKLTTDTIIEVTYDSSPHIIYLEGKSVVDGQMLAKSLGAGNSLEHAMGVFNDIDYSKFELQDFGTIPVTGSILYGNSMILLPEHSIDRQKYLTHVISNYATVSNEYNEQRKTTSQILEDYHLYYN